jgi:hypothetical protein
MNNLQKNLSPRFAKNAGEPTAVAPEAPPSSSGSGLSPQEGLGNIWLVSSAGQITIVGESLLKLLTRSILNADKFILG